MPRDPDDQARELDADGVPLDDHAEPDDAGPGDHAAGTDLTGGTA